MRKFCLISVVCFCHTFGLHLEQYDRSSSLTMCEKRCLKQLVWQFDGPSVKITSKLIPSPDSLIQQDKLNELIKRFISCSKDKKVLYKEIEDGSMLPILRNFARNPIGRELMYRIIAKLELYSLCVKSIDEIINSIDPDVDLLKSVNACIGLLIDLNIITDRGELLDFANSTLLDGSSISEKTKEAFNGLFSTPRIIDKDNTSYVTDFPEGNEAKIIKVVKNSRKKLCDLNNLSKKGIDKKRFSLVYSGEDKETNRFCLDTNEVIITNKDCYGTYVTGPILKNEYESIGILTKWDKRDVESSLKHELGHYFRVTLEEKDGGETTFRDVALAMFELKIPSRYLCNLHAIWDNTEELNEIWGICYDDKEKVIKYDHLNESEFNLCAKKSVRYSHKNSFFSKVPYYIFQVFQRSDKLPIESSVEIPYNELIDII